MEAGEVRCAGVGACGWGEVARGAGFCVSMGPGVRVSAFFGVCVRELDEEVGEGSIGAHW